MPKLSKDYLKERKYNTWKNQNQFEGEALISISLGARPLSTSAWGRGPYQHQLGGEALISISLRARPLSESD